MSQQKNQSQETSSVKSFNEQILVVKRSDIFNKTSSWQGLHQLDETIFSSLIKEKGIFLPRHQVEEDPTYKQIIPYLIFQTEGQLFLMQRASGSSEKRLRNKYTLGIGGHIRREDIIENDILSWAKREFHEEICYKGEFAAQLIGIINDDSNEVGKVHIGCVYLLSGSSKQISIKSELASGSLVPVEDCYKIFDSMESWSQIVFSEFFSQEKQLS